MYAKNCTTCIKYQGLKRSRDCSNKVDQPIPHSMRLILDAMLYPVFLIANTEFLDETYVFTKLQQSSLSFNRRSYV